MARKLTEEQQVERQRLIEDFDAKRAAGDRRGAVEASAKLSAWITANDPPKTRGYGSRAGQRQAAERAANRAERRPRRW